MFTHKRLDCVVRALAVTLRLSAVPACAVLIACAMPGQRAGGGMVTFEATTPASYVAGSTFIDVDGWTTFDTTADEKFIVTPESGIPPGETHALSGSQSAAIFKGSDSVAIAGRKFDADTVLGDVSVLSCRMLVDGTGGNGGFYLSNKIGSWKTPGGIFAYVGGNFFLYGSSDVDTGVSVITNNDYLLEMVLDFTNDRFEGFCTDITGGGSRTSLGVGDFHQPLDPSSTAANGGFIPVSSVTGAGAATIFDDIKAGVIPEPSSVVLLCLGGLGLLMTTSRRKRWQRLSNRSPEDGRRQPGRRTLVIILLLCCGTFSPLQAEEPRRVPQVPKGFQTGWKVKTLAEGVALKQRYFDGTLFDSKQRICVLDVNLDHPKVSIKPLLILKPGHAERTSEMASKAGAVAAVNHWLYSSSRPWRGMEDLLKIDGKVIHTQADWGTGATHAFGVTPRKKALIRSIPPGSNWPEVSQAGAGYGLVLLDGAPSTIYRKEKFNFGRKALFERVGQPRTAVCITPENHVLFVTADGRSESAAGLSFEELGKLMLWLGGRDGVNLDGGGSTTMWIREKGQPRGRVVNQPPGGSERPVITAWGVFSQYPADG